jgi:hypothetical protein
MLLEAIKEGPGQLRAPTSLHPHLGSGYHHNIMAHHPLFQITETGQPYHVGNITLRDEHRVRITLNKTNPVLFADEFANGIFPSIPWFLDDSRPQGFLGKAFAKQHKNEGYPPNPDNWSNATTLNYWLEHGHDMPGNWIIGEKSLKKALSTQPATPTSDIPKTLPKMADAVMRDGIPQSSVGGEQPKFTIREKKRDGSLTHWLVKFSPPTNTPSGIRWADLLICEHIANLTLAHQGIPVANTQITKETNRVFLMSERFDRIGETGRTPIVSMRAITAAITGGADLEWPQAAKELHALKWLSQKDTETICILHQFGKFIANSDMHQGNLSMRLTDRLPLKPTPAYDMLPMAYAPRINGEIIETQFTPPEIDDTPNALQSAHMAVRFWHNISKDQTISWEIKETAQKNMLKIRGKIPNKAPAYPPSKSNTEPTI